MKLALIGKNISHSRSPEVYKKILGDQLTEYKLLNYEDPSKIPTALELLSSFDGISITSPYKKHFLSVATLVDCPQNIPGINVMRLGNNKVEGTNTDFMAIKAFLVDWQSKLKEKEIIILGDGVMSQVTALALIDLNLSYKIYSRKKTKDFYRLSFKNAFVINSCSRDYVFDGIIERNVIFWDYNYNFLPHQNTLPLKCEQYIDGYSLLESQAKYAVQFWSKSN